MLPWWCAALFLVALWIMGGIHVAAAPGPGPDGPGKAQASEGVTERETAPEAPTVPKEAAEGEAPADEDEEGGEGGEAADDADERLRRYAELSMEVIPLFEKKAYAQAREMLFEMVALQPGSETAWYNLACANALLGDPAEATANLLRSIEEGWSDFRHMERDPDLDSLRDLPPYADLLARREEIQRSRAERIHADLVEEFGKGYLYGINDSLRIVFATDVDERTLGEMKTKLTRHARALQGTLFEHGFDQYLTVVIPREWRMGNIAGYYRGDQEMLAARDVGVTLMHEFTHALHFADQKARGQEHAYWTVEGLATLFESADIVGEDLVPQGNHRLFLLRQRVEQGRDVPWKQFFSLSPRDFMRRAGDHYSQARYILFYLHDRGLLAEWYQAYVEGFETDKTGMRAFKEVLGRPVPEIEEDWREWVLALPLPPSRIDAGSASLGIVIGHERDGVRIQQLLHGSGAEEAGLAPGDVITRLDEDRILDGETLIARISTREVGDTVEVEYRRGSEYRNAVVILAPLPGRRVPGRPAEPDPEELQEPEDAEDREESGPQEE